MTITQVGLMQSGGEAQFVETGREDGCIAARHKCDTVLNRHPSSVKPLKPHVRQSRSHMYGHMMEA